MGEPTQTNEHRYFDLAMLPRASGLLAIAQTDRQAAEALHQAQLFPQAVFLLQQAVEKAVKALGLITGVIAIADLQSAISHKAINVFVLGLRKLASYASSSIPRPDLIETVTKLLRKSESHRDRFFNMGSPTMSEVEEWIEIYRFFGLHAENAFGAPSGANFESLLTSLSKHDPFYASVTVKQIIDSFAAVLGLYVLSVATLAHAVATRYGDAATSPAAIYTSSHPLVVHFATLTEIAAECLDVEQSTFVFLQHRP